MSEKTYKIQRLTIENFMRIKAVSIKPDGNAIVISGKNGAGKSSVLDSILAAICGKKLCPKMSVRKGAEDASVTVDLGEFTVTRKWIGEKDTLTVKLKSNGKIATSPQTLLNSIVGEFADDPMRLITDCDAKKQRSILMELAGLNFDEIDAQIEAVKAERSAVLSKQKDAQHESERITFTDDLPQTEIAMADLVSKLNEANAANEVSRKATADILRLNQQMALGELSVKRLTDAVKEAERRLAECLAAEKKGMEELTAITKQVNDIAVPELVDTDFIQADMAGIEAKNKQIRANAEKRKHQFAADGYTAKYSDLLTKMKALEKSKDDLLAKAEFPVKGLSVSDVGVTFDGIPLEQVNTAKQLEVCIAISIKQNPKLRILRMNGNDLDADSLKVVEKIAEENDFQVWLERIEGGDGAFVIEDGSLVGAEPETVEPTTDIDGQADLPFE